MKIPSIKRPKRTVRSVFDLTEAADGLTLPLSVLRQVVDDTEEFSDTATAGLSIQHGYSSAFFDEAPRITGLVVEEDR